MQVSFKQSPQAARATTKSSDVTRMMYASRAVPMAARNAVVGLIEVADGRSGSALYSGLYGRLERVKFSSSPVPTATPVSPGARTSTWQVRAPGRLHCDRQSPMKNLEVKFSLSRSLNFVVKNCFDTLYLYTVGKALASKNLMVAFFKCNPRLVHTGSFTSHIR